MADVVFRGILKNLLIAIPYSYMNKLTLELSNDIFYIPFIIGFIWWLVDINKKGKYMNLLNLI